jgi:hypothetical protein
MSFARFQATHGLINNAPATVVTVSDEPMLVPRLFTGSGAPSATTLNAGNGRYCAANSGWVLGATLVNAGSGYAPGNMLTLTGGTFSTACQITVDSVSATGGLISFHVTQAGQYSAYPTTAAACTGGSGSAATFQLAQQPPDLYFDIAGQNLYLCTVAGSNATSIWQALGAQPRYEIYNNAHAYPAGSIVQVTGTSTVGGVTIFPGTYLCISAVPALASGNQVPQYPVPTTGTVSWFCLAFGPVSAGSCVTGGNIYVNASGGF